MSARLQCHWGDTVQALAQGEARQGGGHGSPMIAALNREVAVTSLPTMDQLQLHKGISN